MSKRLPTEKKRAAVRAQIRKALEELGCADLEGRVAELIREPFRIGSKPFLSFRAADIPFTWSYVSRRSPKPRRGGRRSLGSYE